MWFGSTLEVCSSSRLPGYGLVRGLTQRLAGDSEASAWKPALVEIEDGLVPGFIIEEVEDGRLTVFVPSVPTPLAGAVYIIERARVHPVDVPFTQAIGTVSKWGWGRVTWWRRCGRVRRMPRAHA